MTAFHKVVVIADLSGLRGPTCGVVDLPPRLFGHAGCRANLDDPFLLTWVHETVLREAITDEDVCIWIDEKTLRRLWPDLFIPHYVRAAWEQQHPDLRPARSGSTRAPDPPP
jgi:hypothetical protein